MVDQDVALAKISSIQRCLQRIKEVTKLNPGSLSNIDTQDIFVLNLQRAIQSSIDLAAHIVADEGLGMPQDLRSNFDLLYKKGIIPEKLKQSLRKMVGFRNIAVHEYQTINEEILKSILQHHLKDLEDYYTIITIHCGLSE